MENIYITFDISFYAFAFMTAVILTAAYFVRRQARIKRAAFFVCSQIVAMSEYVSSIKSMCNHTNEDGIEDLLRSLSSPIEDNMWERYKDDLFSSLDKADILLIEKQYAVLRGIVKYIEDGRGSDYRHVAKLYEDLLYTETYKKLELLSV